MLTIRSDMENITDDFAVDIFGEWVREYGLFITVDMLSEAEVISLIKKAYERGYLDAAKKIKGE